MPQICLRVPRYDLDCRIELLPDLAPATAAALTAALPAEGLVATDPYYGSNLCLRLQLNYFHDRGSIPYGVSRPEIGNLVGSSVGDFGEFAEACWRLAFEGWKTVHVERAE
jgi:hypothetical protein